MSDAFRKNIEPPSDLHPAAWAAKHVFVADPKIGEKFDPAQMRHWIKPMGCFADYQTQHIVCLMPTGAGKSTFFAAMYCWILVESPGGLLYASQTNPSAEFWGETRALFTLRKCAAVSHLWPSNMRNSIKKDVHLWPHMWAVIGGANMSNFQEKSVTYGFGDEAWIWADGMVEQFLARSHKRENRKFVLASQAGWIGSEDGVGKTSELHIEHDKCRKWSFAWQCPECGSVQAFDHGQMQWDEILNAKGQLNEQASADTVRRVCPGCSREFADTQDVRRMLHNSYKKDDGYLLMSDEGRRGYEGFHVDRGAIWRESWADDLMQKMTADRMMKIGDDSKLRDWTQKNRAKGYCEDDAVASISLKRSNYSADDVQKLPTLDGEKVRFMTIDVGDEHWWVTVRAWWQGGDSQLVFFDMVTSIKELEELPEKYGVQPIHVLYDVGWEQENQAEIIRRNGWQGLKGDGSRMNWDWQINSGPKKGETEKRLFSKKWYAKAKTGAQAICWHMATTPLQNILQRLINGDGAKWESYDDVSGLYAKHLNGERLEVTTDAKGNKVKKWVRRGANHARDCEVMQLCAAIMFRVFLPAIAEAEPSEE